MMIDINTFYFSFISWFLVLTRLLAFFAKAPFFTSNTVSARVKFGLAIFISFILYKAPAVNNLEYLPGTEEFIILISKEIVVGLVLGFIADFIYIPLRVMGVQIGRTSGLGRAQIFNPDEQNKFTVVQQFMYLLGVLIFFSVDGHHILLKIIYKTYEVIPLGSPEFSGKILKLTSSYFNKSFTLGVAIAAPIMGSILINSLGFGILSKSVPQMNLFILDLPLRVFIGLAGLSMAIPMIVILFKRFLKDSVFFLDKATLILGGAQ